MEQGSSGMKIFVVEDNEWYNRLLVHTLGLNPDYEIKGFLNAQDCLDQLHQQPDIVTLDFRLPDAKGSEVLRKIKDYNPEINVIIISEQDDIEVVVDLLKEGAYDYLVKSDQIKERLLNTVQKIRDEQGMKQQIVSLQKEVQGKYDFQSTIIGNSPAISKVFNLLEKAIRTNIIVSVTGETGTGKEVVAKAIHYNSDRKNLPFVPVNMAAIPGELIESELFGHEKGAFTGAAQRRIGKFEEAGDGTIFLDEIGEMNLAFQAKLLRVIQEKEVVRIGSNEPVKINCRIIVATNRNLKKEVEEGRFREDLYYRLYGLNLYLPPLRERGKDVLTLSKYFLDEFCRENKLLKKSISSEAQAKLLGHTFPGNVRELKSVIELAVTLSNGDLIEADDVLIEGLNPISNMMQSELTLREYSHEILRIYMDKYNDNTKLIAEKLDIGVTTIYRMLKEMKE